MLKIIAKTNFNPFYGIFMLLLGCIFVSTNQNNCFYLNITSDHILQIVGGDYTNLLEIHEKFQIDTTNAPKKQHTTTFSWSTWGVKQFLSSLSFDYTINNNQLSLQKCKITMVQLWRTSYMYFEIKKKIIVDLNKMNEVNVTNLKIESTEYNNVYLIIKSYSLKFWPCVIKATTVAKTVPTSTKTVPTSTKTSIETNNMKPETKSETANEKKIETKYERTSAKNVETKSETTSAKKAETKSETTNEITTETKSETTSGTKTGTKLEKLNETKTETKNVNKKHGNDNTSYTALKMILIPIVIIGMLLIPVILFSLKKYKQHLFVTSRHNTAQDA